ncbi:hypothetical protein FVE85_7901 [Porphyridium purpureum]|uniref:Uncharacterized protein n=1 Tax=Porphyridium purpureum TaxID=35688 RepID=A0A5J4YNZ0_PORPP|nr:hypothetical protein FVE85_7901 [Porphyridium purpureum]|eukprot:POR2247..scf295_9
MSDVEVTQELRDKWEAELNQILEERRDILNGTHAELRAGLEKLNRRHERYMLLARDQKKYQLQAVEAAYKADISAAWDEYYAGRSYMRDSLLKSRLERERRMDLISFQSLHQKLDRKRKLCNLDSVTPHDEQHGAPDRQRNKLIALTPDEIQHDLESVLQEVEKRSVPKQPLVTQALTLDVPKGVYVSHSKLFFFDEVFELNNLVVINSKLDNLRFNARITQIHLNEMQVAATNGKQYLLQIAHLQAGKTTIARRKLAGFDP